MSCGLASAELGDGDGHAGILTTAGKLLFTGDNDGNLLALAIEDAQRLRQEFHRVQSAAQEKHREDHEVHDAGEILQLLDGR